MNEPYEFTPEFLIEDPYYDALADELGEHFRFEADGCSGYRICCEAC